MRCSVDKISSSSAEVKFFLERDWASVSNSDWSFSARVTFEGVGADWESVVNSR
jgi:hypothetical protein